MTLDEYQQLASETDQNPMPTQRPSDGVVAKGELIPLLGMVGEVGTLLSEYKKLLRDGPTHIRFKDQVAEELGDVLWYVANVATKFGFSLGDIATQNIAKTRDRWSAAREYRSIGCSMTCFRRGNNFRASSNTRLPTLPTTALLRLYFEIGMGSRLEIR